MAFTNKWRVVLALAAVPLLAGQATPAAAEDFDDYRARRDSVTRQLGNSVAHNIAVQTDDPWPRTVSDSRIHIDGKRLLVGAKRYQANKSIPPSGMSTQAISAGKPNGGGGGAGAGGEAPGGGQ